MNSPSDTNTKLRRTEGLRRAALHFAEDFVLDLCELDKGIYQTNGHKLQASSRRAFGHELNMSQVEGLIIFIRETGRLHKDNQQIFAIASFMCDILDDSMDIRRR